MDVFATMICTAANVEACRAAQSGASFAGRLSAYGLMPATHYVASGWMPQADVDALAGLCAITTGTHEPLSVIAAAGLQIAQPTFTR